MVSFTGSTRAGVQVAINAAPTVKRVTQELGGKSANIILDDADFQTAVAGGVNGCFTNSGQSCNAPTRMLVPARRQDEAVAIAKAAAEQMKVGDPFRRRHQARSGGQRSPVQQDPGADSARASTRAPSSSPAAPAGPKASTTAST